MSTAVQPLTVPEQPGPRPVNAKRHSRIGDYAILLKMRITTLVVITAWTGYYMGAQRAGTSALSWKLLCALLGIGLVSGGASALNQVIEREADGQMRRTQQRPLPARRMGIAEAAAVGIGCILVGAAYLAFTTNLLTGLLSVLTAAAYVGVYTPLKKFSPICTTVGALPGAMPPLLGWTAARGRVEWEALVLFAILFLWQFPHFHAIAWLYREDYGRAGIRMLPVVEQDGRSTVREVLAYSMMLVPVSLFPGYLHMVSKTYLVGALFLSLAFLFFSIRFARVLSGLAHDDSRKLARELLRASIVYLPSSVRAHDVHRKVPTASMSIRGHAELLMPTEEKTTKAVLKSAIQVELLGHRYGDRVALNEISFDVRPAEIFGLLGPNGSGKTTLFRILSTLMIPTSGYARILGFDPVKQSDDVRRRIGVVAQAQSVDVKLSAAENLMHQGHLYGIRGSRLKKRIAEMLERVGLADRANDLVETFSGGMQRRVELAKGLMHSPSVLLLDEPTTGLDPGARRDLWMYLDMLREQEGVTVLVTTHLMEEAERCSRLAILSEGKIVGLGTPSELKSEIGGDVIRFEAERPEQLALLIEQRFGIHCSISDNMVRLEREQGHRFAADVMEAFPGGIRSVSVSRPTLEDVFINRTGHRFWTESQNTESEPGSKRKKKH